MNRWRRTMLVVVAQTRRFSGPGVRKGIRQHNVIRVVVGATGAEHKGVHTHAHVTSFGLDTLPDEHTGALQQSNGTGFGIDLEVLTA